MSGSLEKSANQTVTQVTTANEVRGFLRAVPRNHDDTRETFLQRVGSYFGLTPRRTRSIWYGEKVRIDHDEYVRMRGRYDQLCRSAARRQELLNHVDDAVGALSRMAGASAGREGMGGGAGLRAGGSPAGRADASDGSVLE